MKIALAPGILSRGNAGLPWPNELSRLITYSILIEQILPGRWAGWGSSREAPSERCAWIYPRISYSKLFRLRRSRVKSRGLALVPYFFLLLCAPRRQVHSARGAQRERISGMSVNSKENVSTRRIVYFTPGYTFTADGPGES